MFRRDTHSCMILIVTVLTILAFQLGIPLLFDLYEGCQKSFDLGPVKVGEKIIRTIEVMNHSKIAIDASFMFRDMYPVAVEDNTNSEATSVCLSPSVVNLHADTGPSRYTLQSSLNQNLIKINYLYPFYTQALS